MREEKDALGAVSVPDDRYYGATTARSLKSFNIGWHLMPRPLIDALLLIKEVAVETNMELGLLSKEKGELILKGDSADKRGGDGRGVSPFPFSDGKRHPDKYER